MTPDPLATLLAEQDCLVLDGGLATALEARGFDLQDELWSARLLLEEPEAIRAVHLDFLRAGADCITTASYQASFPGLARRGLDDAAAVALLRLSTRLAVEAREEFWSDPAARAGRCRPLVAASVGPYGAYLADGSEYRGDYGVTAADLRRFHERRLQVLAATPADLLACETIPSRIEAQVLLELLEQMDRMAQQGGTPAPRAWLSFSCRDGHHLCDGSSLQEVARRCEGHPALAAVGVNCTAPQHVAALIEDLVAVTRLPVLVYPGSGERYDPVRRCWLAGAEQVEPAALCREWRAAGARGIGGCCRISPAQIARIRRTLLPASR